MKRIIEICANSAQSCVEAEAGGATRVELCAGIPEGGTTPSYGEIKTAKALTSKIDINVIIRPRGGDFLYTEAEVQSMLLDIELCKELKVHGVVFGCLTKDGDIDVPLMRRLIEAAKPLSVTCHRAFDVCRDPFTALEQLIELGCDRILTSVLRIRDGANGSGEGKSIYLSAGIGVSLCRYWCSPTPIPASPHAYTGVGRYQYSYAGEMFFLPKKIVSPCERYVRSKCKSEPWRSI